MLAQIREELAVLRHRLKLASAINEELSLSNADLEALLQIEIKEKVRRQVAAEDVAASATASPRHLRFIHLVVGGRVCGCAGG